MVINTGQTCLKGEMPPMPDLSLIDQPNVLAFFFYPRQVFGKCPDNAFDFFVPVEKDITVSCRFYAGDKTWPTILYFYGNGEVASEYTDIARFYHHKMINLVVADYRGYGMSQGKPSFANMQKDAHILLRATKEELSSRGFQENLLWVMGRSLGSVCALELAFHYPMDIRGVIIESGLVSIVKAVRSLGLASSSDADLKSLERESLAELNDISLPALIIHGEYDEIVPLRSAELLFMHLGSPEKYVVTIPFAGHNDIMFVEPEKYFGSIHHFIYTT
jgi:alpha-beta hydrolase superfamily lysophospholipase